MLLVGIVIADAAVHAVDFARMDNKGLMETMVYTLPLPPSFGMVDGRNGSLTSACMSPVIRTPRARIFCLTFC